MSAKCCLVFAVESDPVACPERGFYTRVRFRPFPRKLLPAIDAGVLFFGARYGAQTLLYLRTHLLSVAIFALTLAALSVIALQIMDRLRRRRSGLARKADS